MLGWSSGFDGCASESDARYTDFLMGDADSEEGVGPGVVDQTRVLTALVFFLNLEISTIRPRLTQ